MTDHTAQIIQRFAARPKAGKKFNLRVTVSADRPEPGAQRDVSGTAENFRLRQSRYYDWRQAASTMDYWRAAMKMKSAISCVQNYGTPEGDQHDFVTDETQGMLVTKWRAAWACLMAQAGAERPGTQLEARSDQRQKVEIQRPVGRADPARHRRRCRMAASASSARVQAQTLKFGAAAMSADIISFPGDRLSDHQWTQTEVDKLHGDAFRDLEMSLRDCVRMCEIATEMIIMANREDKSLTFAAAHLANMLIKLEEEYDARWHGERKP